ncbi:glycerophosphodiester phosphodiesterase family protein [Sphingobium bisphenolivorans]|uniref:glycerophosphodiester phosphodiesterase family protein n=1 Tax=Sphingobium bisphenolivorans TaxID=1335760 RepID=UPI0004855112
MAAFEAAIARGFGIECDVRLSRDGVPIIFHDAVLTRLTRSAGAVANYEAAAIAGMSLPDGSAPPMLDHLLQRCAGTVPLLIEIKADDRHVARVCAAVAADLARHPAAQAAIMSFNPMAVRWFRRQYPDRMRGLVVAERHGRGWRGRLKRALALWLARPDFIACDIAGLPSSLATRLRARGVPVLTWTVRTAEERARAARHADQIIFEQPHD